MLKETLLSQVLDGTLKDYKKHLSGVYEDYYICIDFKEPFYFTRINVVFPSSDKDHLETFLASTKKKLRHLKAFELNDSELVLAIVQPNFKKNVPTVLNTVIKPIIEFLAENNFTSGCGKCGSDEPVYCTEVKKQHHHYCEVCSAESKTHNKKSDHQN